MLPIPFTDEAVQYVAARVRQVQDLLEQRIALENISYYAAPGQQMEEADFINAVLEPADCDLLLDINKVYVNSVNHGYDPLEFLRRLPGALAVQDLSGAHFLDGGQQQDQAGRRRRRSWAIGLVATKRSDRAMVRQPGMGHCPVLNSWPFWPAGASMAASWC